MCADSDQHKKSWRDGAMPVLRIGRLLAGFGVRIPQSGLQSRLLQCPKRLGRAIDDEYRMALPAHDDLLAWCQWAEIDIDGYAGSDDIGRRVHLIDQGPGHCRRSVNSRRHRSQV